MRSGAIAFLAGILLFQQLHHLPQLALFQALLCGVPLLLLIPVARAVTFVRPLLFMLAGIYWAFIQATLLLSNALPASLEKVDLVVKGAVASIAQPQGNRTRFMFDIEQLEFQGRAVENPPPRVRLNWYRKAPDLNVGDRWRLTVRLKRPHGFMNPGGFDYEGWLFQQRIGATGYVRSGEQNRLLSNALRDYPVQRLRQALAERITATLDDAEFNGIITALAIGERQLISDAQWQVLRKSGTVHLIAISGLHIGLVAGMAYFLVLFLWSWAGRGTERWPAPRIAALAGIIAALFYAALAGFTIPTQRALVMVVVAMLMLFFQRHRRFSDTLALTLFVVLIIDPFTVMSAGFWLSFGAVAAIIFAMSGRTGQGGWRHKLWWRWGRVHVIVMIGLIPLLLVAFQQLPLLSPIANFIAVPWVSIVVVPLVLLGAMTAGGLPVVSDYLLNGAAVALAWLWPLLEWITTYELAEWQQHIPMRWTLFPALIGTLLLLSPRGLPGRWLGIIWLLPLFLVTPQRPAEGEWWFTLLDVGQGLAAVVQTRNHLLVYDTGPRFSESFDTGRAVVIPFLRSRGVAKVDRLVIGHGDNDHIGGARSLSEMIEVEQIITSVPQQVTWQSVRRCMSGEVWQWDGVQFEVLHPPTERFNGNDGSCVLRISSLAKRGASLLLTGDIEVRAERALLRRYRERLQSQIVVAPHHGSRSSSSEEFVRAVSAQYVLFPIGYLNRYGFPHPEVEGRYRRHGSVAFSTERDGAVTFKIGADGEVTSIQRFRDHYQRYWHAR